LLLCGAYMNEQQQWQQQQKQGDKYPSVLF
jgi:hypothetical protein